MARPTPEQIVRSTHEPAFAVDETGAVVAWNEGMERLLGHGADQALQQACHEVVCGRDVFGNRYCAPDCNLMKMIRHDEAVHRFELDLRHAEGHPVRSEVMSLVIPGDSRTAFTLVHLLCPASNGNRAVTGAVGTGPAQDSSAGDAEPLTTREKEILQLLASGAGTQEIADSLFISAATVRSHVQNLLRKLGVHSKLEAVALAFRRGLV